jgi:hypothetical protein
MSVHDAPAAEFRELRPRLLLLLELHGKAASDSERAQIAREFETVFLATAWHVAKDLLENGYEPVAAPTSSRVRSGKLKLVGGADAA